MHDPLQAYQALGVMPQFVNPFANINPFANQAFANQPFANQPFANQPFANQLGSVNPVAGLGGSQIGQPNPGIQPLQQLLAGLASQQGVPQSGIGQLQSPFVAGLQGNPLLAALYSNPLLAAVWQNQLLAQHGYLGQQQSPFGPQQQIPFMAQQQLPFGGHQQSPYGGHQQSPFGGQQQLPFAQAGQMGSPFGQIGQQFGQGGYPYALAPQTALGQGGWFGGGQGYGQINPLAQLAQRAYQVPGISPWAYY